jgi:hypothetical protein
MLASVLNSHDYPFYEKNGDRGRACPHFSLFLKSSKPPCGAMFLGSNARDLTPEGGKIPPWGIFKKKCSKTAKISKCVLTEQSFDLLERNRNRIERSTPLPLPVVEQAKALIENDKLQDLPHFSSSCL